MSSNKLIIECKIHGEFLQSPNKHLIGRGCPKCSGCDKMNTENFIEKADIKHDYKYDYSKSIYINGKTKINIICPTHGIFTQKATNHLQGQGCDKCRVDSLKITKEKFLERLNIKFPNHYELISEYISFTDIIKLRCIKTNEILETIPKNILLKNICKVCVNYDKRILLKNHIKGKTSKLSHHEFIRKSNKTHYGIYDYSITKYTLSKNKVEILCNKHGIFKVTANHHIRGTGCPKCRESKGETNIRIILEKNNIQFQQEKIFDDLKNNKSYPRFDFYIPKYNTCIEFDGKQHYEAIEHWGGLESFKQTKINDENKNKYCKNKNINLIRIPYWEINNIEHIIIKNLKINKKS